MALTDHDTLAGCRDVLATGAARRPELITGVEINAVVARQDLWESELHVLGFGMDPTNEEFEAILATQRARRRERFERTVAVLRELGLPIDEPLAELDLRDDDALGRPTIARALVELGSRDERRGCVPATRRAGCPAYVPRSGLGPVGAIEAIRAAGGLAALAHFREALAHRDLFRDLHRRRSTWTRGPLPLVQPPEATETMAQVAQRRASCQPGAPITTATRGLTRNHTPLWVPPEVGAALTAALASNGSD